MAIERERLDCEGVRVEVGTAVRGKVDFLGGDGAARAVMFATGATRSAESLYDPSGFLHPRVLQVFSEYMERHRVQADGQIRASDNWQKGMPTSRTIRSTIRHVFDLWLISRGYPAKSADCKTPLDALCAIYFNVGRLILNYDSGEHYEEGGR